MKPEIYIRVDGNAETGLGHIVRCSALAYMLKHEFKISFFCRSIPDQLINELQANGFKVVSIKDEEDFLGNISNHEIVVLDGYKHDTSYHKAIKSKNAKLVCIDDLNDRRFVADLIINTAPGSLPKNYKTIPYTLFALGLDYVLLRPQFLKVINEKRKPGGIETVMINFGGADPHNYTLGTLKTILNYNQFKRIIVITGTSYKFSEKLARTVDKDKRVENRHSLSERLMVETMLECELAIVPSSGVLFEILATGCKVISGYTAVNQILIYQNLKRANMFVDAKDFSERHLKEALVKVGEPDLILKQPFDGNSPTRLSKLFKCLSEEYSVDFREADENDLEQTFKWASDSKVRRYSFQTHKISHEEHSKWFRRKLNDTNCFYLIANFEGNSIGSIRFDSNNGVSLISFLVDPLFHGRGFGLVILKKGLECYTKSDTWCSGDLKLIKGMVIKENIASIKIFERLGFSRTDRGDCFVFEKSIE